MIDGIRALIARVLRDSAARLDPNLRKPVALESDQPAERPWWETKRNWHVSGAALPALPDDPGLPVREVGPYEKVLTTPDIMTYIDKESFDRMAKRAREGWDKTTDKE